MTFHEKLQELRKQKAITQEELAASLFVSRTAVSKWESGRGYPSIDSLKALAGFYGVSIDCLLSNDELLTIAEEDGKQRESHSRDLVFGLLDLSAAMLFFLPVFGQSTAGVVREVSLLLLREISPWLRICYFASVAALTLWGILTLALQNCRNPLWVRHKSGISLLLSGGAVLLFIISRQPYGAALLFIFLTVKALLLLKRH